MRNHSRRKRGAVIIYVAVGVAAFAAIVSMAVDIAHVRLVKTQLQTASDAAARAGAQNLQSGVTAATNAAVAAAAANTADGTSVVVNSSSDIAFGTWSNGTFTVLTGSAQSGANAVQVTCTRSAARGNAVSTAFGGMMGIYSCNVSTQTIATGTATPLAGFIGYAGVTAKNNAFFGSYDSSVRTNPTESNANANVRVGSNSFITTKNNDEIEGSAVLGPGATVSGATVTGSTINQGSPIPIPTLPAWSPGTNPGSISQTYAVSSATTLPGGSYWFTSLSVDANLTFSGSTVIYVNGPIEVSATLTPASAVPSDLVIYQYGSTTFGDGASNGMTITAEVLAPGSDFTAKNNLYYAGSGIFNSITTKNNADFFYDQEQGAMNGLNAVATVQ